MNALDIRNNWTISLYPLSGDKVVLSVLADYGKKIGLNVSATATIREIKKLVEGEASILAQQQGLFFKGESIFNIISCYV